MATLNELLAHAAQMEIPKQITPATLAPNTATNAVLTQRTGAGASSAPEIEQDLATMGPAALYLKYGNAAEGLINARVNARGQINQQQDIPRTNTQAIGDTAIDVISGAANLVAGPIALGAGMMSPAAGASVSQSIESANRWAQDQQSDALAGRRSVNDQIGKLNQRDTTKLFQEESKTDGSFLAGLKRIGRDVIDSVSTATSDPMTLASGIAQGVGSILPIGPASTILEATTGIASKVAVPAVIGATTAGSTYQQTSTDVSKMTHAQLLENSPTYRDLIQSGVAPEKAKQEVQHRSGMLAAAISAPASIAAGRLVAGFEGDPLARVSARTAVKNMLSETVEEGIQSGAEKLGQNIGTQLVADQSKTISEGVGEQIGQGALYGLGTAGVLQSPSIASGVAGGVVKTFATAASAGLDALQKSAENLKAKNQDDAPTSEKNIRAVMEQAPVPTAEDIQTAKAMAVESVPAPDQERMNNYVDSIININNLTPEEISDPSKPESIRKIYETASDRLGVMTALADEINKAKPDDMNALLDNSGYFYDEVMKYERLIDSEPEGFSTSADNQGAEILKHYSNLARMIGSNPKIQEAIGTYVQRLAAAADAGKIPEVTEQNIVTPEGSQAARATVALAQSAPDKANLNSINTVLKHASAGDLALSPSQEAALKNSRALLMSAQAYDQRAAALNARPQDIVSKQIKTEDKGEKLPSGLEHARGIYNAVQSGNTELATSLLEELGMFAQHMQNKLGAFNEHFEGGTNDKTQSVKYQSLTPSRKWRESKNGVGVTRTSEASLGLAQQVSLEAEFMTNLYNNMVDAFPDLGLSKMEQLPLAEGMVGDAVQLAKKYDAEARAARQAPVVTPTVNTEAKTKAPSEEEILAEKRAIYAAQKATGAPDDIAASSMYTAQSRVNDLGAPMTLWRSVNGALGWTPASDKSPFKNGERIATLYPEATSEPVVETKPEPVQEPVVSETVPAVEATPAPIEPVKKGLNAVFTSLVQGIKGNEFIKAFKAPKEPKSRAFASESPLADVAGALSSNNSFRAFTGQELKGEISKPIADAYLKYLRVGRAVGQALNENLNDVMNASAKGGSLADRLEKGDDVTRFTRMRLLNIAEKTDDGFEYNKSLMEGAVLAGLQWLLSFNELNRELDEKRASSYLGISEDLVTPEMLTAVNDGVGSLPLLEYLSRKIQDFWGLSTNSNAPMGYTEGIPHAMAAELLRVFLDTGVLESKDVLAKYRISLPAGENGERTKELIHYSIGSDSALLSADSPMRSLPHGIEQAVLVAPTYVRAVGGPENLPPVPTKQLRSDVDLTTEQQDALKNERETKFFLNLPMVNLYKAMGKDGVLEIFGAGNTKGRAMNEKDRLSADGKNAGLVAAFDELTGLVQEVSFQETDAGDTPIHYAYEITSVGRMQMMGLHNPQSSKLMREAVLPTWSVLDLSQSGDAMNGYMLGLAQALGVKVHTMSLADSVAAVTARLDGQYANVIEKLRDWQSQNLDANEEPTPLDSDLIKEIKTAMGSDVSFVGMHALMDYARLLSTDDKSAFRTSIYVEADGVTNGPINASIMMSSGEFTADQLLNFAKGGLFIGGTKKTMNDHRSNKDGTGDTVDMYQAATSGFDAAFQLLRNLFKGMEDQRLTQQMDDMLRVLGTLVPDITFDEDKGTVTLKRGVTKNPLTITVYGSGAMGIASKFTGIIEEELYARQSIALENMRLNEGMSLATAMFGAGNEAQFDLFTDSLNALTQGRVSFSKKRGHYFVPEVPKTSSYGLDHPKFELTAEEKKVISQNIHRMFVDPMREGISKTIGQTTLDNAALIQQATQIQSLLLANEFQNVVAEYMERKKKADPDWKTSEGLSQNELAQIRNELGYMSPLVQDADQRFAPANSENVDIGVESISAALNDQFRLRGSVSGYSNAGVRATPMLVIGMGDGNMMQKASVGENRPKDTLKIFDGMNMKLSTMNKDSEVVNAAAFDSWVKNPMAAVAESYEKTVANLDKLLIPDSLMGDLVRTLKMDVEGFSTGHIRQAVMEGITARVDVLKKRAADIQARHDVLKSVNIFADQMASTGDPFENKGEVLTGSLDEIAAQLNGKLATPKVVVAAEPDTAFADVLAKAGRAHSSGVRVLSMTALKQIRRLGNLEPDQKVIFDQALRSLEGKGYSVFFGSKEQISKYRDDQGLGAMPVQQKGDLFGWTDIGLKHVYVVNPSAETLVHEIIHAATYETVLAHYNGTAAAEIAPAITRIEALMNQFEEMDESIPSMAREAYSSARGAMASYQADLSIDTASARAGALNEFMAWALSNKDLIQVQKKTEAMGIFQLVKDAIAAIRALIWGKKVAPKVGTDMLSNLQFNTAIIMRAQPRVQDIATHAALFQNMVYGNSERLVKVGNAFTQNITKFMNSDVKSKIERNSEYTRGVIMSQEASANAISAGFFMKAQEKNVFEKVVAALATSQLIDPTALTYAQEVYAHTVKNLSVEDFMTNPQSQHPADRYYAQQKYDVIVGNLGGRRDMSGRTNVLPVFLGLALVHDGFREILKNKPLPQNQKSTGETLDDVLANVGNTAMYKLGALMGGAKLSDKNALAAIDSLTDHIVKTSMDNETFIDQVALQSGGVIDRMNQYVVDGVEILSDAIIEKAKKIEASSQSHVVQLAATTTRLLASLATDKNGQKVAEGVISGANRVNMWKPFQNLLIDLVGRTSSNAAVYDLIKAVRSMVQQDRQQFREELPEILAKRFTRVLKDTEWGTMYHTLAKTDIMALSSHYKATDISDLIGDDKKRAAEIKRLEDSIKTTDAANWNKYQKKAKQLANFMVTGQVGNNLLRNAEAVANLFGETSKAVSPSKQLVSELDRLISLYAFEAQPQTSRDALSSLVQEQKDGVTFVMSYLQGLRKDEVTRASEGMARFNHYKGFTPSNQQDGVSLIIRDNAQHVSLKERSYVHVVDYKGSNIDASKRPSSYYFAPVTGRAAFSQGILQNVRSTGYGVDVANGYSTGVMTAGRIVSPPLVKQLARAMSRETVNNENLMPIYDEDGTVTAFERSVDPIHLARLNPSDHLGKMIGSWAGRQIEERKGAMFNEVLVDTLHKMWSEDVALTPSNQAEYVNLFDSKFVSKDPVLMDALKLMTKQTTDYVESKFPEDEFWVRKDLLEDSVGYRMASIGDAWTGNTRLNSEVTALVKNVSMRFMGNDAYKMMVGAEDFIQNYVRDVKSLIVVKSVVVPAVNFVANMLQMIGRGVPMKSIGLGMAQKTTELNAYTKSRVRFVEADAELKAAAGNVVLERKLKAEMQSIQDSWARMSIWPLLQAGEFSAISDASISQDELALYQGKLGQYVEQLVDRLPDGIRTAGRYALVTKDTALFKGMQTAVQYGDFLAKSIMFDHLTQTKKMKPADAMGKVTEEFVNYDRLPGRFRGYGESVGLLWFYNFKIRSAKIAVSMIRNNPVHTLLSSLVPTPDFFGSVGTPVDDNLFSIAAEGRLPFSIGPGQGLSAFHLNPWVNLAN